MALANPLSDADATVQSMEDASPAKWHLAHTTWFFETFVLRPRQAELSYKLFDERYGFLFNSYYEAVGARHPRPRRGMLTRPTLKQVRAYRAHVDRAMSALLANRSGGELDADLADLIEIGLHHEQQHQELLLTDILHLFAQNPLRPAYRAPEPLGMPDLDPSPLSWIDVTGGEFEVGADPQGFRYDCETPRHRVLVPDFKLASRPATNADWIEFIEDGGYEDPLLWLSDGWACAQREGWRAPLYWENRDGEWWSMSLRGFQPLDPHAAVSHISYFEADAFAAWRSQRLPTEFEWERAAQALPPTGNFADCGRLRPACAHEQPGAITQMFGDVWEWTRSPFTPYPGFKAARGAIGEYNGKFMSGQYVLRGGSCVTPKGHIRASYRNFFHPDKRWQFSGVRLAQDL